MANPITVIWCPECELHRSIQEPRTHSLLLACGHTVSRNGAQGLTFEEVM